MAFRFFRLFLGLVLLILLSACSSRLPYSDQAYLSKVRKNFFHGNVRINYYEFGRGEPIIFLHGFGGASYTWRHIYPSFEQDHHIFLLDLKGFGLSDRAQDGNYSVNHQADIIKSFIVQKNLEKVALVGHSFGGAVALLTYFKVNESEPRIKSLILLDSASYPQSLPNFIKILRIPIINILLPMLTPTKFAVKKVLKNPFMMTAKLRRK